MTTLFDTSALLAVLKPAEPHHRWSVEQLEARKADGPVLIVDIVYSEISVDMTREQVAAAITYLGVDRLAGTDEALFRAGKAFRLYKERKGTKTSVLPDFLIGAAACVAGIPLVTTNAKDFFSYFSELDIISPSPPKRNARSEAEG